MNKILFIDSYYAEFVSILSQACMDSSYDAMRSTLDVNRFGTGSALAFEFSKIGWETRLVIPNFRAMQDAWRMENGFSKSISKGWDLGPRIARVPGADQVMLHINHIHSTIYEQVKSFKPDIVYVQDLNLIPPALIKKIREFTNLVVGEIASPLPPWRLIKHYDMVLSALQPMVAELKSKGMSSHWVPLGFDLRDWDDFKLADSNRSIDVSFVGSISRLQKTTIPLIKRISESVENFSIYGPQESGNALAEAGLSDLYRGTAWASQMFEIFARSQIVVNRHGEIAKGHATNMRMYESTGMGALLMTDATKNLEDLFRVNEEVVVYEDPDHAAESIAKLLEDKDEIQRIASQGQLRTHSEHTYTQRVQRMIDCFVPQ
jgi:spore maturation protein CgeB